MFDLLGTFSLDGEPAPVDAGAFLHDARHSVAGSASSPSLRAVWLGLRGTPPGHAAADGRHLLVLGDVFHRTDSAPYAAGGRAPSPEELLGAMVSDAAATLRAIKGSFTLVLSDEACCAVYASRAAMSPFYYAVDGSTLVFSSSLRALVETMRAAPDVDAAGVAELALFNYPVGDRTFFRGTKMLQPGELVVFDAGGVRRTTWWAPATLYEQVPLPADDALEQGAELFHRVVNDAAVDQERLRVSFTSGFDSRAILAVLDRPPADLLTYAFGIPGSLNVSVPEAISQRLGIPFRPLYLEEDYESAFDDEAFKALELSDALATVERANYPYAFRLLAGFSPVVLTGLFSSELLRTFQNVGHIVSAPFLAVNAAPDPDSAVEAALAGAPALRYFDAARLRAATGEVAADLTAWRKRLGDLDEGRRFYMFLLLEGLRKYFGAEVHMERPWGRNRFPFLDDEFVEFAFRAPFSGVHGRHTSPTIEERFRSQYFYAFVIRRYRPELLRFTTDHGYPPGDVLSRLWPVRVGGKFVARRLKERWTRYREFRTEEWTEALYRRHLPGEPPPGAWTTPQLLADLGDGSWRARRTEFAKAASLELWLERL